MKRRILVGVCAVALALGPFVVASPASAESCPPGTKPTRFDGVCVSGGSGGGAIAPPLPVLNSPGSGAVISSPPGQLPSVNGIPCTPEHLGTCIGLTQSQG